MSVIGRREFEIIMKLDDQTAREREKLNRGLGNLERTSKRASEEAKRSIVEIAKASKSSMEGLKAVLELGGWYMMAQQVAKTIGSITAEARKNSIAFKEASNALKVVQNEIGAGIVKALEPVAEGFKNVLLFGTAVFKNFPEVARSTFDFVKSIINKAISWEGIKGIVTAWGEGLMRMFLTVFEYIPRLFNDAVMLMFNPIKELGAYIADTIGKAFTLQFDKIKSPGDFMSGLVVSQAQANMRVLNDVKGILSGQLGAIKTTAVGIGKTFAPEATAYSEELMAIIGPTLEQLNRKVEITTKETSGVIESALSYNLDAQVRLNEQLQAANNQARQEELTAAVEHAKRQAEAIARVRAEDLAGKNGLGAAVSANLQGTELLGGAGAGIGGILSSIFSQIGSFLPTIQNVMALLNPMQTIIGAIFDVLGPVINDLLAPLVGVLRIVGMTIGRVLAPALQLLKPIIEFLGYIFLTVYNYVIRPVANAIIVAFNWIYNGVADFVNGILWLIDQIPFVDVGRIKKKDWDAGTLQEINMADLYGAGGSTTGTSSAGSSASYAAGTSITIESISISADFIAGEAGLMDVAVKIRDLILEAERLGR